MPVRKRNSQRTHLMESLTPAVPCVSQNSKKRRFHGGSSSGCKDVEVLETSPPINRTSRPKPLKQKEVHCHEIIDFDMDEVCGDDVVIDGEAGTSGKGKDALSNFSVGYSSLSNDGSGSEVQFANNVAAGSHTSVNADDFSSNLFYGEDEWVDTYYDDISYDDDYAVLESHFDHMDIPPGVEAPFPWLPTFPGKYKSSPTATTNSSSDLQLDGVNLSPSLNLSHLPLPLKPAQISDQSTSRSYSTTDARVNADNHPLKAKQPRAWLEPDPGHNDPATLTSSHLSLKSSGGFMPRKSEKEPLHSIGRMKLRSRISHGYNSKTQCQSSSKGSYLTVYGGNNHPNSNMSISMPKWNNLNMWEPSMGSSGFMNESSFVPWAQDLANDLNGASSIGTSAPTKVEHRNVDEILQNLNHFKKFDIVVDHFDHYYSKNGYSAKQPPRNWAKRIQEEWKILEKDLPDTIFVRVYESRMDLLRAVIVGADGTPYHDGLFFFDVFFPCSYPNVPPHVHYHSGGLRINPNLYNCGKVCLSLVNTWNGSQKEKWISGVSTMLQVLVSIQGLILNAKPYFNGPGYANMSGSASGEKKSLEYNERTFINSLQTMVYNMRRPPKYFEDFVAGHFCKHAREILVSCKAYLNGARVGCLVKGGVEDIDNGDKNCSKHFKLSLAGFITPLVNSFSIIGAKDCQEFLYLAQKATEPDAAPMT